VHILLAGGAEDGLMQMLSVKGGLKQKVLLETQDKPNRKMPQCILKKYATMTLIN
jgi:hypothetical protein